MRKLLKRAIMLLCICVVAMPLISCGNNSSNTKESTPEETLKTYIDSYKREKDIKYSNLGLKEDELKNLVDKRDYNLTLILFIDQDKRNDKDFWNGIYSSLGKVEVDIKNTDEKDNKASLEISSKPIDLKKIHHDALMNTKKKIRNKEKGDKSTGDIYMEFLKEELANTELCEEKTSTINLEKNSEGKWIVSNDSIAALEEAIATDGDYTVYQDDLADEFKDILKNL